MQRMGKLKPLPVQLHQIATLTLHEHKQVLSQLTENIPHSAASSPKKRYPCTAYCVQQTLKQLHYAGSSTLRAQ